MEIKKTARLAVMWGALNSVVRQSGGFVISIVLARLLTPEDFGTVALLAIFIGIANVFVNVGLGQALIQRQNVTHMDESTVFWFNLLAAFVMMSVLIGISPWIADFFALPVLIPLTIALAINIVIGALGSIHMTLLTKRLDFKTPMKVGAISTFFSGAVAIYMAWNGYGLWALVFQTITSSLVGTGLLWLLSPWRPLCKFSADSFRNLFGFGGWLFLSWLLDTVYQRGYTLLIGKFYSTYDLGIYNRAYAIQQLPVSTLTEILQRVSFPILSRVSQEPDRMRRGVRLSIRSMMLVTTPVLLGLFAVSEPFVLVVFGKQWLPAVPILRILCFAGVLWPLHIVNLSALQAKGHSKQFFKLEIVKKSIGICLLIAGCFFGILGIAWSRVIQSLIALRINSYYTKKYLDYGILAQVKDILPSLLMSAAMAMLVSLLPYWFELSDVVLLIISIATGAFLYLLMSILLGGTAFKESLRLIRGTA